MSTTLKPILYLDIDDTILSFKGSEAVINGGKAARGASSFLRWIDQHFEVRLLTLWATKGRLDPDYCLELEQRFGVSAAWWSGLRGLPHSDPEQGFSKELGKIAGIDWVAHETGRPWIWLEDMTSPAELEFLKGRGCLENWIPCNVSKDPTRLITVRELLTQRFGLHER